MFEESKKAADIIQSQFGEQEKCLKSAIEEASLAADAIREIVKTKEIAIKNKIKKIRKSKQNLSGKANNKIISLQINLNKILKCEQDLQEAGNPCDYVSCVPSLQEQLADINNDISYSFSEVDLTDVRRMISDMKVSRKSKL